jgi:RNA polymerase sigma-70 factor (ECF subfamily)
MADAESRTNLTLLHQLRQTPTDEAAWNAFVDRYGRMVYRWCRHWGLQDADAEDVTQNVLLALARQMRAFVYQPSGRFRGWLRTVAQRGWMEFLERRKRQAAGSGDSAVLAQLHSLEAGEDLVKHLNAECDRELMEVASQRVRQRVAPQTWEAFRLTAQENLSGAEASQRIGMQVGQVFVAKRRVQQMLREEIDKLDR